MTMREADEALLRKLPHLRVHDPDAARSERMRARCRAALAERHAQAERRRRRQQFIARVVEPVFVGSLSASYLLAMVLVLLRLHGIL